MRVIKIAAFCMFFLYLGIAQAAITVGSCNADKHPYATISAAIAAAKAYEIIDVCPGSYPEQLTITKPLTIKGLVFAKQSGVTITAPANGEIPVPNNPSIFRQILVSNAGGPVNLSNLSIVGSSIMTPSTLTVTLNIACSNYGVTDASGVTYENTPGTLDHLSVSQYGQFWGNYTGPAGEPPVPDTFSNCGSGIEFYNDPDTHAEVRESSVNAGVYGIYSSGVLTANHNVVSVTGPYSVGIDTIPGRGMIIDNTISGSVFVDGSLYINATGIEGGEVVRGNVVQFETYGIMQASEIHHNTLLNNSISVAGEDVSRNLIYGASTYIDPRCSLNNSLQFPPACLEPTVGINLACAKAAPVRDNSILNVGIGVEGLETGSNVLEENLFAGVTTTSTSCAP